MRQPRMRRIAVRYRRNFKPTTSSQSHQLTETSPIRTAVLVVLLAMEGEIQVVVARGVVAEMEAVEELAVAPVVLLLTLFHPTKFLRPQVHRKANSTTERCIIGASTATAGVSVTVNQALLKVSVMMALALKLKPTLVVLQIPVYGLLLLALINPPLALINPQCLPCL